MRRLEPSELADPTQWRQHLGRRTSVRVRLHDDPEHPFTEAAGVVQSVTVQEGSARLTVVTRRGELRTVLLDDVLAAKVF